MTTRNLSLAEFNLLRTMLHAAFNQGLTNLEEEWKRVAHLVPSNNASNSYHWFSQLPAFRQWLGKRLHKKLSEKAFRVDNILFETTIDIPRVAVEDGNAMAYSALAISAGESVIELKNNLVFGLIKQGFSDICYDGQPFFDTDHPVYPNEDGTGTPFTISNFQQGSDLPWVLLCTKRPAKPFYLQQRTEAEFYSITSPQNDTVYDYDLYSFGGRYRGVGVLGFWQCAYASKAPLNAANFNKAYAAMMKYKGDGNRAIGMKPDLLVVPSEYRALANDLLLAERLANGSSNTNYKAVDLHVTSLLD